MELSRVLWACRRGMLELDLLLGPYAKGKYPVLSDAEQAHFDALLAQDDQTLFEWFMGKRAPAEAFSQLVNEVQAYAIQTH